MKPLSEVEIGCLLNSSLVTIIIEHTDLGYIYVTKNSNTLIWTTLGILLTISNLATTCQCVLLTQTLT